MSSISAIWWTHDNAFTASSTSAADLPFCIRKFRYSAIAMASLAKCKPQAWIKPTPSTYKKHHYTFFCRSRCPALDHNIRQGFCQLLKLWIPLWIPELINFIPQPFVKHICAGIRRVDRIEENCKCWTKVS